MSWWKEELPSEEEMIEGRRNLLRYDNTVDFKKWFFGHYHDNRNVNVEEILLWEQIM